MHDQPTGHPCVVPQPCRIVGARRLDRNFSFALPLPSAPVHIVCTHVFLHKTCPEILVGLSTNYTSERIPRAFEGCRTSRLGQNSSISWAMSHGDLIIRLDFLSRWSDATVGVQFSIQKLSQSFWDRHPTNKVFARRGHWGSWNHIHLERTESDADSQKRPRRARTTFLGVRSPK